MRISSITLTLLIVLGTLFSGTTAISADAGTDLKLERIVVSPVDPTIPAGNEQQFVAIGNYSDDSTKNITQEVTWTSSNISIAYIDSTGLTVGSEYCYELGSTVITATAGETEWERNGETVCTTTETQSNPEIVSDINGASFLCWTDNQSGGTNYNVYLQKLSPAGDIMWGVDGVLISVSGLNTQAQILPDDNGGVFITWRNPPAIHAQHIDSSGNLLWPVNGVVISNPSISSDSPEIVSDNEGGAIISWNADGDLYAQRIDPLGNVVWVSWGIPVCLSGSILVQDLISDGSGGGYVVWSDNRTGNYNIYVQHLDAQEGCAWTENGVSVFSSTGFRVFPSVTAGDFGSIYVTSNDSSADEDLYVQHLDSNGNVLWGADGFAVSTTDGQQAVPEIVSDGAGGAIVIWQNSGDIYAQRIDSARHKMWVPTGTPVCDALGSQYMFDLVSDESGGVIITWVDDREGNNDIYAQRISGDGQQLWESDGICISGTDDLQNRPKIASFGTNSAVIVWEDSRNDNADIYAQKVNTISGNATLTISEPVLEGIRVSPDYKSVQFVSGIQDTVEFQAYPVYSAVVEVIYYSGNWTSSNTSVATINSMGSAMILGPGDTTISFTDAGLTGNATLRVIPDLTPPVVRLTGPNDGKTFSNATANVTCSVNDLLTVACVMVNGGLPISMGRDGSDSFSRNVSLSPGYNTIRTRATDLAGNIGESDTVVVLVDPNRPDISIITPVNGTIINSPFLSVTCNVSGANETILMINGETLGYISDEYVTEIPTTLLKEGENVIVIAGFASGMEENYDYLGSSGTVNVVFDTTPPILTIVEPAQGSITNQDDRITVSGFIDDGDVEEVQITCNGYDYPTSCYQGEFRLSTCSLAPEPVKIISETILNSGINTVTVTATDAAGNTVVETVELYYDPEAPQISLEFHNPGDEGSFSVFTGGNPTYLEGYIINAPITSVQVTVNGVSENLSFTQYSGRTSFGKTAPLLPGKNTVAFTASDTSDNIGNSGVYTIISDTEAPLVSIGLTVPGDKINVTMVSNEVLFPKLDIVLYRLTSSAEMIDRSVWGQGYYGNTSFGTIEISLENGDYSVRGFATDMARNETTAESRFAIRTISVNGTDPTTILAPGVYLELETNNPVNDARLSILNQSMNPVGIVPEDSNNPAGLFCRLAASSDLMNNLENIYLEIEYDEAELNVWDINESSLRLHYWNPLVGEWELLSDSQVDTERNVISGTGSQAGWYGGIVRNMTVTSPNPGDADGNGSINVMDITKVVRILLMLDAETPGADANGDGTVDVLDITVIVRKILGLE